MTKIVTRAGKGAPLTNVEVDVNFTNLNNDKIEKTGGAITANTSTPALTITQTGTGDALRVEDSASPDSTPFVIDANGNVSVGGSITQAIGNTLITGGGLTVRSADGVEGGQISLHNKANTDIAYNFDIDGSDHGRIFTTQNNTNLTIGQLASTGGSVSIYTGGLSRVHVASDGNVGIGGVPSAGQSFANNKDITGATISVATVSAGQVRSDVTSQARYFQSLANTQATTFKCYHVLHYLAEQGTFGAGSTVTEQTGFYASSALVGATKNYGFLGAIPAGTGRYNFYAAGSADNYFAGSTGIGMLPISGQALSVNGTAGAGNWVLGDQATTTAGTFGFLNGNGPYMQMWGAGTPNPSLIFFGNNTGVLQESAAGLGYGTGAGGTVTQATSKSTAVTLNKPTGQITMNNAALAANTSVAFTLSNSVFSATDNVIVQLRGGITHGAYQVWAEAFGTGTCNIVLRNISGVSLSESVVINFAIIKGSVS